MRSRSSSTASDYEDLDSVRGEFDSLRSTESDYEELDSVREQFQTLRNTQSEGDVRVAEGPDGGLRQTKSLNDLSDDVEWTGRSDGAEGRTAEVTESRQVVTRKEALANQDNAQQKGLFGRKKLVVREVETEGGRFYETTSGQLVSTDSKTGLQVVSNGDHRFWALDDSVLEGVELNTISPSQAYQHAKITGTLGPDGELIVRDVPGGQGYVETVTSDVLSRTDFQGTDIRVIVENPADPIFQSTEDFAALAQRGAAGTESAEVAGGSVDDVTQWEDLLDLSKNPFTDSPMDVDEQGVLHVVVGETAYLPSGKKIGPIAEFAEFEPAFHGVIDDADYLGETDIIVLKTNEAGDLFTQSSGNQVSQTFVDNLREEGLIFEIDGVRDGVAELSDDLGNALDDTTGGPVGSGSLEDVTREVEVDTQPGRTTEVAETDTPTQPTAETGVEGRPAEVPEGASQPDEALANRPPPPLPEEATTPPPDEGYARVQAKRLQKRIFMLPFRGREFQKTPCRMTL